MPEDTTRAPGSLVYRPRNPRKTPLWQVLNSHFDEFLSAYEDRFEQKYGFLRDIIEKTVQRYLRCGILDHGFARVRCADCGEEYLLAFSCKCRSFCPSCQKKRQLEFAQFAVNEVFARVPHRQVVLSIPKRIRTHFFRNRKLLGKLARCGWETVRDFLQAAVGRDDTSPGAVVAIQTFGNLGDLNPHLHMIFTWGCFDRTGVFHAVRDVPDNEMIEQVFRHKVFRLLLDEDAATEDLVDNMLSWRHSGFSCYVGRAEPGRNTQKLESLAQYISRGAVALERMTLTKGGTAGDEPGKVIYRSNKVHPGHGANFRIFDVLDFIAHLSSHIPSRHEKHVIWYGWYSNKSRGMRKKQAALAGEGEEMSEAEKAASEEERAPLSVRRAWAYLVSRIYEVDPLICPKCGGEMKMISCIHEAGVIFRILDHLGLLLEEDPVAPSDRSPPEVTYEPFFDDLPAGEADEELLAAVIRAGLN